MTTHWMGYDVETSGDPHDHALQPWRVAQGTSWVTSTVAIDPVRKTTIEACLGVDPASRISAALRATLEHALAHDLTVVGWNVAFDIQWMIAHGLWDLVRQVRWLDGMLLWKQAVLEPETQTATKRFTFGLKECVRIVLPQHAGYEDGVDFHGMDPETVARRHDYNRRDVAFTLLCARHWWSKLNDRQRNVALIEAASLPQVARANFTGMKVDTLVAREVETHLDKAALIEMTKLRMLGATREKLASPVQLAALIFDEWGLPSTKVTATGGRSTDKEVLTTLALDDPRVAAVLKWRNSVNSMTKFAIAPRAAAEYNGDGMARPQAIIASTYTARFSYASNQRGVGPGKRPGMTKQVKLPIGFALHQMQRGPMFRQEIIAPEGFCVVEFDAAGQEFRWMAIMSNDQVMLRLCRPGEDPHGFMGAQIGHKDYRELVHAVHDGEEWAKSLRQLGKVGNLCIAEGATILTDRGPCAIERVRDDDLVWDGVEFVAHDGVRFSGFFPTVQHDGVRGTPDHKVLCDGDWVNLETTAEHGRPIEPALGAGRACRGRSTLRIVDGLVRRAVREVGSALRQGALRLWGRAGCESALSGDRPLDAMQRVQVARRGCGQREVRRIVPNGSPVAQAGERLVSTVSQPQLAELAQLRSARDRVSLRQREGCGGLDQSEPTARDLRAARHRPDRQRWSLRAWQSALGLTKGEPGKPQTARTYDIVNCGPRRRFAANGRIVHNSAQYRTSPPTLRKVANIQYGLPMTEQEAKHIIDTYRRTYPGVPLYWQNQIAFGRQHGYVENLAGRRVRLRGNWMGRGTGWALESATINWPIQSIGAEQKYLALKQTAPIVHAYGNMFAWDLHDGLYFYARTSTVEKFMVDMKQQLDHLDYEREWGYKPTIPLPFDCKFGPSWGKMQEVKF